MCLLTFLSPRAHPAAIYLGTLVQTNSIILSILLSDFASFSVRLVNCGGNEYSRWRIRSKGHVLLYTRVTSGWPHPEVNLAYCLKKWCYAKKSHFCGQVIKKGVFPQLKKISFWQKFRRNYSILEKFYLLGKVVILLDTGTSHQYHWNQPISLENIEVSSFFQPHSRLQPLSGAPLSRPGLLGFQFCICLLPSIRGID